jgi:hypothetical protein
MSQSGSMLTIVFLLCLAMVIRAIRKNGGSSSFKAIYDALCEVPDLTLRIIV